MNAHAEDEGARPGKRKLLRRGEPEIYSGEELKYIGMPVGGFFAGTVYLGGDGQLWNWDIFNQGHFGCVDRSGPAFFMNDKLDAGGGANYVDPVRQQSPFEQRFRLLAGDENGRDVRFGEIRFRGEYPIGQVSFGEADSDVEMKLEAFSPFIPLQVDRSSYPATTLTFSIKNIGAQHGQHLLVFETENPVLVYSKAKRNDFDLTGNPTASRGAIFRADPRTGVLGKDELPVNLLPDFGSFCIDFIGGADHCDVSATHASIGRKISLQPGETQVVTLILAWHFPNCAHNLPGKKNWYASKWADAEAAANDLAANWPELQRLTRLWNQAWYDSTLPYWFLDRTFVNTSILATKTCNRLDEGRFYFWEGAGCCEGTCTHVWGYAQAIGRLFPEVERFLRKEIDFGRFYHAGSGAIDYRGEYGRMVFVDGQSSCILRAYREHLMSPDKAFLESIWPHVKGAMDYLIRQDPGPNGILEGAQFNTLDTAWYGEISWISSLYVAALRAAEAMASVVGDTAYASLCSEIAAKGSHRLVSELFNGEYFINHPDAAHPEANNTNVGCHIDQIYGQSWALQVALPRIVPPDKAKSALRALYKHNFYDDVWEYRRKNKAIPSGRWYATPKEAGLIMCTFPRGGAAASVGKGGDAWAVGYFNECMSGFEYQVAAHMIAEGMMEEGLTVVHAIHQRYHPSKRNPYNEIECSDHYGRAMASYGAYVSMCGLRVDGPAQKMSFNPKISGRFKCAFVNEQGWGSYERGSSGEESVVYALRLGSQ